MNINKKDIKLKLEKLSKKLKNKTVVFYGAGLFFQEICKHFNLSEMFNVIGISDLKFQLHEEGQLNLGYKIIPKSKIEDYNPDYVLVSALNFWSIIDDFTSTTNKNSHTTLMPLIDKTFVEIIKENFNF